jgi:hypothetical protein
VTRATTATTEDNKRLVKAIIVARVLPIARFHDFVGTMVFIAIGAACNQWCCCSPAEPGREKQLKKDTYEVSHRQGGRAENLTTGLLAWPVA